MTDRSWWGEDFERTISSYQKGSHAEGMEACERLLSDTKPLPPDIERFTRQNQTWYLMGSLAGVGNLFVEPPYSASFTLEIPKYRGGWSLFNPSIAADNRGNLKIILRSSNYHIEKSGRYTIHDGEVIRTINWIARIEPDGDGWHLDSVATIDTDDVDQGRLPYLVQGFEDARLFYGDGTWQFLATVRDRHPDGLCQIARCSLDGVVVKSMNIMERHHPGPP